MILSKKSVLSVSLFILILWGVVLSTFANPPTSPYGVSQNIVDPACAPNSLNCYVASLSIGDTIGNSPDANGILYVNNAGDLTTDALFTREDNNTYIAKEIETTAITNMDVVTGTLVYAADVVGAFQVGETITGGTSGATAVIDYIVSENSEDYLYLSNISGPFQALETVTGNTSFATGTYALAFPAGQFAVSDTFFAFNLDNQQVVGQGTITDVTVDGYSITLSSGTVSENDLIFDDLQNITKLDTIRSVDATLGPGPTITTSIQSGDSILSDLLPGGYQGTGIFYQDSTRLAGFYAGNDYFGNDFTFNQTAMDLNANVGISIAAGYSDTNGDPFYQIYYNDPNNSGFGFFGFSPTAVRLEHGEEIRLYAPQIRVGTGDGYGNGYYLPVSDGTNGQVLTTDGSGNVTWETVSGGSLPDQGGHGGEFLTTDGVTASWAAASSLLEGYTNGSATALGVNATGGQQSAVFGNDAGNGASYNNYSTIIGSSAGTSGNIDSSVLIGLWSGQSATAIDYSVAIGYGVGSGVDVIYSNFIGATSGQSATNAFNSNFFGYQSGAGATNAAHSIFIGNQAGYIDTVDNTISGTSILIGDNTSTGGFSNSIALGGGGTNTAANQFLVDDSYTDWSIRGINYVMPSVDAAGILTSDGTGNLSWETALIGSTLTLGTETWLGYLAGDNSASTVDTVFIGGEAGSGATAADQAIIIGKNAGIDAVNAYESVFLGFGAGIHATNANDSNFFGQQAGGDATNAQYSNFFGLTAGNAATNADFSNFIGSQAGYGATNADNSNFLGQSAGQGATGANNSNFLGYFSGFGATAAQLSNFFGNSAGHSATNAYDSNFFGTSAGYTATNADDSNFIGSSAGYAATNASYSNFLGYLAGYGATDAANSIFIGRNAGYNDTVDNTGSINDFSILIGKSTSTGGFSNSIAIGGSAVNTASNQFMIGSTTRPIDTLVLTGSAGNTCVLDVTVASPSCSSDETLKTDITDLSTTTLENLLKVKTVTYNWKNYPDKGSQIGFLAQDLEQYFPEVVSTAPNGFKTVSYGGMAPILVEAVRELDLKITNLTNPTDPSSIAEKIIAKLIKTDRIETKELCVDDVCVTRDQFFQMVQSFGQTPSITPPTDPTPTTLDPLTCTAPQVLNQTGDACVDPVAETPEEIPTVEEPSTPTE